MLTVAIQGQVASYHSIAADNFFSNSDKKLLHCANFSDVFNSLKSDQADYGLVAIENSLYGSINEVYDLLLKSKVFIVGEVFLRISHCLIGQPGAKLSDITKVHSHPVALAQCEDFLSAKLPHAHRQEEEDTAGSVEIIANNKLAHHAAIASEQAAEHYNLHIVARNIESHHENFTRFIVVHKNRRQDNRNNKTSLVLKTNDTPGALYNALGAFASKNINLKKLQSRPIIGNAWGYMFYVDVDAGDHTPDFNEAMDILKEQQCSVINLGSYQAHKEHI